MEAGDAWLLWVTTALAATALMNSFLAASSGMLSWLVVERVKDGHFTVLAFSFVVTAVIAKALDALVGLRVDRATEAGGLDRAEHAETGYGFAELGSMHRG